MRALFLAFLCLVVATPAHAAPADERRAILQVVQQFFDALAEQDSARVMTLVVADGTIAGHDMRGTAPEVFTRRWPAWAERLREGTMRLREEMHGPRVRVRGNLGLVWTEYSFHRDGAFSHCGVDLFDMAKVDGRWRILNLSFTMESRGCRRR